VAICLALASVPFVGCNRAEPAKTHTIGVVQYDPILSPVFEGFKAKMVALSHVEGTDVTYVYHGLLKPDPQVIEREVQALKDQRVDVLLTLGTQPALAAKKVTAGTAISVVFAPVLNPVGSGVVSDVTHPGGNVTGVRNGDTLPKSLEWLHRIVPSATKIYAIYHPKDAVAQTAIRSLPTVAAAIGSSWRSSRRRARRRRWPSSRPCRRARPCSSCRHPAWSRSAGSWRPRHSAA
jgi:putative ABC transport system substrate-binding protein